MGKICFLAFVLTTVCSVQASWYWPFGSDEAEGKSKPRLSELMESASLLIDEASDLAADGKIDESVEKYRKALLELDRIELENPERAKTSEFATLRNKRAYVNAAIDAMLLGQVQANAKAVAVSDTTELERRLAEERGEKKPGSEQTAVAQPPTPTASEKPAKPLAKRELAMADMVKGYFASAEVVINEMLEAKPNSALALNLKATMLARQGNLKEAQAVLDQSIMSNPRDYHAYYNMAILVLQENPANKKSARRYYETGRTYGGPKNPDLEAVFQ